MAEPGAVVAAISDQMFGLRQCGEHEASAPIVTHLAFRQEMIGRRPLALDPASRRRKEVVGRHQVAEADIMADTGSDLRKAGQVVPDLAHANQDDRQFDHVGQVAERLHDTTRTGDVIGLVEHQAEDAVGQMRARLARTKFLQRRLVLLLEEIWAFYTQPKIDVRNV